jgi:hypothetical protein
MDTILYRQTDRQTDRQDSSKKNPVIYFVSLIKAIVFSFEESDRFLFLRLHLCISKGAY